MISEFKNLTEQEAGLMFTAPVLVTLLIAGAEGRIEEKETDWGAKIAHFRASAPSVLQSYYQEVDKSFNDTMKDIILKIPPDVVDRNYKINQELSKLNDILKKLDSGFAKEFYKSLLSLSKQVAQSSGGVWGYGAISPEEKALLNLEVINDPNKEV